MNIENAKVVVRSREAYEALDLGIMMGKKWYGPMFKTCALMVLPVFMVLSLLFMQNPAFAMVLVWWLKPFWERPLVLLLGRLFFGETLSPLEAIRLAGIPRLRRWVELLIVYRFSPLRSYLMPVDVLEGLHGGERKNRKSLLGNRQSGVASAHLFLCINAEMLIYISVFPMVWYLIPETVDFDLWQYVVNPERLDVGWWSLCVNFLSVVAMLIMMPFYVAGGFGLYINRRVELEGWDIDLTFRRMRKRLMTSVAISIMAITLGTLTFSASPMLHAESLSREEIRARAQEVMSHPDFGGQEEQEALSLDLDLDFDWEPEQSEPLRLPWEFGNILVWVVGALGLTGLVMLLLALARAQDNAEEEIRLEKVAPPTEIFGLDLRGESLPPDIVQSARDSWRDGDKEGALSLLYRGLLHHLVNHLEIRIPDSATEGECVTLVRGAGTRTFADVFGVVTEHWLRAAYGKKYPTAENFEVTLKTIAAHLRPSVSGEKI